MASLLTDSCRASQPSSCADEAVTMDGLPDALAVESQSIRQLPPCPVPAHPKVRLPGASSPAKPTSTPSLTGKLADCLTDKPTAKLTAKLADKQPSDLEQRDGITALAATTEPSPSQQAPATFQSLPREIRHEIYKLVLADHMHKTLIYGLPLQHRTRLYSALALTSWQTRRETLAIMYAYNTWTIKLEYAVFYREFVRWIERVGDMAVHAPAAAEGRRAGRGGRGDVRGGPRREVRGRQGHVGGRRPRRPRVALVKGAAGEADEGVVGEEGRGHAGRGGRGGGDDGVHDAPPPQREGHRRAS